MLAKNQRGDNKMDSRFRGNDKLKSNDKHKESAPVQVKIDESKFVKTNIDELRHSLAHLLAAAVLNKFPKAKLGIGPVIEDGFYYDFKLPKPIAPEDLPELEKIMRELIAQELDFSGKVATPATAKKIFKDQPYKLDLIEQFKKEKQKLTIYKTGDIFTDLCRGGHVKNTKEVNPNGFKLTKIAGAYWRGDAKNDQLTRIYGVAFNTKQELEKHLQMLEEAKKRDHRVLGERLGIFMFSDSVGPGFPLLLPNGELLKHELIEYMREKEQKYGYQYVSTPVLTHGTLFERSGHKQYFSDDMYHFTDPEGAEIFIKPMNCPFAHMIYEKLVTSYRDLPIRLAEAGAVYRFELSGTLTGLIRVRGPITQNDAHIYTTEKQLKDEFKKVLDLFGEVYRDMKIEDYWFRLSLPDFKGANKEKFGGNKKLWQWAAEEIEAVLKASQVKYEMAIGEAAFYGPKLDVQAKNVLGKEDTIATVQVDILVPERMGLTYVDEAGKKQTPIVIHRAIVGSYERFIAFLLEKTAGKLPIWLAPTQAVVIPIGRQHFKYGFKVFKKLEAEGVRVILNNENLTVGKKIREAEIMKVPYVLVVGDREINEKTVSVRHYKKGDLGAIDLDDLICRVHGDIKGKK